MAVGTPAYMLLDHSISRTRKDGLATLTVSGPANPAVFKPLNGMTMQMKH